MNIKNKKWYLATIFLSLVLVLSLTGCTGTKATTTANVSVIQQLQDEVNVHESKIAALQLALTSVGSSSALATQVSAIQTTVAALQTQVSALPNSAADITAIKADIDSTNVKITSLQSSIAQIPTINTNITQLQTDVAAMKTQIATLQGTPIATDWQTSVTALTTRVKSLEDDLASLQADVTSLQTAVKAIDLTTLQSEVDQLVEVSNWFYSTPRAEIVRLGSTYADIQVDSAGYFQIVVTLLYIPSGSSLGAVTIYPTVGSKANIVSQDTYGGNSELIVVLRPAAIPGNWKVGDTFEIRFSLGCVSVETVIGYGG